MPTVFDLAPAGSLAGSAQYVEGKTTKADNPHMYRLATYRTSGRDIYMSAHSPSVKAWIKDLEAGGMDDDDTALAARLAAMPAPSFVAAMKAYKTHGQRMTKFHAELDKANKNKSPVVWAPMPSGDLARMIGKTPRYGYVADWTHANIAKSTAAAVKRGDIIPNIPNTCEAATAHLATSNAMENN